MAQHGKHALITGSSRGIGRGIALKLAESGVRVAIHYYQNKGAAARWRSSFSFMEGHGHRTWRAAKACSLDRLLT